MSQDNDADGISRRRVLGGAGAATGAAVLGGLSLTGSAAAASTSFNANDVTVASPDGSVEKVFLNPSGDIMWEDFSEEVQEIDIRLDSRVLKKDGSIVEGWKEAYANSFGLGDRGGHYGKLGADNFGQITLYEGSETSVFEADADGSTRQRKVELRLTIELLNGSGDLARPTDKASMTATTKFLATSNNHKGDADFQAEAGANAKPGTELQDGYKD